MRGIGRSQVGENGVVNQTLEGSSGLSIKEFQVKSKAELYILLYDAAQPRER